MNPISRPACCVLFLFATAAAQAVDSEALASCASLESDISRLGCYDRLSGRMAAPPDADAGKPLPVATDAAAA
ncbi:MAG TPA: hypothetical protein VF797_10720, partial [Noviherbaspirillum sp.]